MAYCRQCGNEVAIGARFCRVCGGAVRASSPPPVMPDVVAPSEGIDASSHASSALPSPPRLPQIKVRNAPSGVMPSNISQPRSNQALFIVALLIGLLGCLLLGTAVYQKSRALNTPVTDPQLENAIVETPNEANYSGDESIGSPSTSEDGEDGPDANEYTDTNTDTEQRRARTESSAENTPVTDWTGERYPQTRIRLLTDSDISGWDYARTRYAINEMYARYGYGFQNKSLYDQFRQFPWYRPKSGLTTSDVEAQFSPVEMTNMRLLAQHRNIVARATDQP